MSEEDEYPELYTRDYFPDTMKRCKIRSSPEQDRGIISKIFSSNKKKEGSKLKMPIGYRKPVRKFSPKKVGRLKPNSIYCHNVRGETFLLKPVRNIHHPEIEINNPSGDSPQEIEENMMPVPREMSKKEKLLQEFSRDNAVLEVVSVEDRGTDPWDQATKVDQGTDPCQRATFDRGTDPIDPSVCTLPACQLERKILDKRVEEKEKAIAASFQEGCNLLKEIYKIKETVYTGKTSREQTNENPSSANELVQLSYKCLKEISAQLSLTRKHMHEKTQNLTDKLTAIEIQAVKDEAKIKKLELIISDKEKHDENYAKLRAENNILNDALQHAKKLQKDTERLHKEIKEKLEKELAFQTHSNAQNSKALEEKSRKIDHLERTVEKLRAGDGETRQQITELHSAYKSKIAKLEQEHSSKMSDLCEHQAQTNKQLTHALDQSSKYVNLYQEVKKENVSLIAANKAHVEKSQSAQRELAAAVERCQTAERKLAREAKQAEKLKDQLSRLSEEAEQELLTVNGDLWCQIMKHHDQLVIDDYMASLQFKEKALEGLRAQGDCALKDFEIAHGDLQKRRQQFKELKTVLIDFERKRETLVREQRDFYAKMTRDKAHVTKDTFLQSLIEECQTKSEKIEDLEDALKNNKTVFEETSKITGAQFKAMQAEMQKYADKVRELESQTGLKELHLQEVARVLDQEKRKKAAVEEAIHSNNIMLEDLKKENSELRHKLSCFEDLLEKHRTTAMKTVENMAVEKKNSDSKFNRIEKHLEEIKNQMQSGGNKAATDVHKMDPHELKWRVQELTDENRYINSILDECQQSKESLLKDHGDLSRRLKHAIRIMIKSKVMHEELERKLEKRTALIEHLESSQLETEDRLQKLKDVVHEMQKEIEYLEDEREDLKDELASHSHCRAERTLAHKIEVVQREKKIAEESFYRERESLLKRLNTCEVTMRDQQKHIRDIQAQLDMLTNHLRETKAALSSERHAHTQDVLEKKKLELYAQDLQAQLTRLNPDPRQLITTDTTDSSPHYSDSCDPPPRREHAKPHHFRK